MGFITIISCMVLLGTLFAVLSVPRGAVALCSFYFSLRERKKKKAMVTKQIKEETL